jgi:hypothetical protein
MQPKKPKNKSEKRILDEAIKSGKSQVSQVRDPAGAKNDDEDALPELTPERINYLKSIMTKLTSLATHEERKRLVDTLAPETVEQLRVVRNPYHLPVFKSTHEGGSLCFSVINVAEKYQKRFAMTSLIAFVYQMMEEYEAPGTEKYTSENDSLFAGRYNVLVQQAEREKPLKRLEADLAACQATIQRLHAEAPADPTAAQERQSALVKAAKESFRVRARIAKYKLLYYQKDLTSLEDLSEAAKREIIASDNDLRTTHRELEVAQIKWHKRQLHDAGKTSEIEAEEIAKWGDHRRAIQAVIESRKALAQVIDPKTGKPTRTTADNLTPDLKNQQFRMVEEILHAEDLRLDPAGRADANGEIPYKPWDPANNRFTTKLAAAQRKLEAGEVRAAKAAAKRDEYVAAHDALQARITEIQTAYKGLKTEWDSRFVTPLRVEAVKKKETRKEAKRSGEHPLDAIEVARLELDADEYDAIVQRVKTALGITLTREEFIDQHQEQLEQFLNSMFKYNPQNHVRCAYKPNYPENFTRPPTEAQMAELQREAQRTHARSVIPPDDTFYRLDRFQDAHYEELRQATDDIYSEKSDFEFAIVPYDSFRGEARHEKAAEFRRKYAGEFEADVHEAEYGQWTFLSAWSKNRDQRDFVTKDSEILKRIMDQNELDQKAGAGINALRKRKARERNTAEHGEHAASFANVKKQQAASLERHGAKPQLKGEEIGRDDRPSNPDEVEVGVFEVKPQRVGKRRIRGHTEKWNFMIPSVPLDDSQIKVQSAQEFRGEQARQEGGHP